MTLKAVIRFLNVADGHKKRSSAIYSFIIFNQRHLTFIKYQEGMHIF